MAIFHLSVKIISRSKGRSATAAAAYRHAMRLQDERTGATSDYRRKPGVLGSVVLTPPGAPAWARDRAKLWNTVERQEKRCDAQLAREIEIALPAELDLQQQIALTTEWARTQLVDRGMIADVAFHGAGSRGDRRNDHVHIMTTLRRIDGSGFGLKERSWGDRRMLQEWRKSWAEACNRHLEGAGSAARIDHRTLAEQGIDRAPTRKQGKAAREIDRKIGRTVSRAGRANTLIAVENVLRRRLRRLRARAVRELVAMPVELIGDVCLDLITPEHEYLPECGLDLLGPGRSFQ